MTKIYHVIVEFKENCQDIKDRTSGFFTIDKSFPDVVTELHRKGYRNDSSCFQICALGVYLPLVMKSHGGRKLQQINVFLTRRYKKAKSIHDVRAQYKRISILARSLPTNQSERLDRAWLAMERYVQNIGNSYVFQNAWRDAYNTYKRPMPDWDGYPNKPEITEALRKTHAYSKANYAIAPISIYMQDVI